MTETGNVHQKITLRSQAPTSKIRSARKQLFPLHAISNDFFGVWEKNKHLPLLGQTHDATFMQWQTNSRAQPYHPGTSNRCHIAGNDIA